MDGEVEAMNGYRRKCGSAGGKQLAAVEAGVDIWCKPGPLYPVNDATCVTMVIISAHSDVPHGYICPSGTSLTDVAP